MNTWKSDDYEGFTPPNLAMPPREMKDLQETERLKAALTVAQTALERISRGRIDCESIWGWKGEDYDSQAPNETASNAIRTIDAVLGGRDAG